jgi:catechol 2,3-dioxygenase-like lactoylglutathione lyase family enzyme
MIKKATEAPFMPAGDYGRSLRGMGVNLLVRSIERALPFFREVLEVEVVHADPDFAVLRHGGQEWMLHADHTYTENPLLALTGDGALRGAGIELRLYDIDPDAAAARAEAKGYHILQPPKDKPHGLRETYLVDVDGYVWVPGQGIPDPPA